ncbi:unnamed protein product [Arabis nemorensis]|uniref:Uncharacterized protein n=1 Tax=Arabis nemorensis TaxID=586526 RepID=A0A565AV62_9BRAS|nr:unnamed protein product [Arabis nemorensis]
MGGFEGLGVTLEEALGKMRAAAVFRASDGKILEERWKPEEKHERSKLTRGRSSAMATEKGAWVVKERERRWI